MMPSASNNTKLEKQVSGTPTESTSDNNNATNPMKQALVTIEHKIRNLEKRKTKLESYRAIQASGKELSADQKAAVAKYDAVTQTLEFARDLSKQMVQFSKDAEKEQKKQARKDAVVKAQTETSKIREVLIIQNILTNLCSGYIREMFLSGQNGAVKLESTDLENLEKFNMDIQTRRPEQTDDVPFLTLAQKAAEYLSMTIDGRPKQYGETTFENIKRIFNQIQECGFLDKVHCETQPDAMEEPPTVSEEIIACEQQDDELDVNDEIEVDDVAVEDVPLQHQEDQQTQLIKTAPTYDTNAPIVNNVYVMDSNETAPVYPPHQMQNQMPQQPTPPPSGIVTNQHVPQQQQQHQQQQPQQMPRQVVPSPVNMQQSPVAVMPQAVTALAAPVPGHFPATTVRAVEEAYFKQQQQQFMQMRPLAEVIGGGNFFFLQDSELDSPDMGAATYNNPNEIQPQCSNVFNTQHHAQQPPQQLQQQQQQHQMQMIHSPVVQQPSVPVPPTQQQLPKGAHVNMAAPIPTQTFTNQSFPPIVQAPTTLYPVAANSVTATLQSPLSGVPSDKHQIAQPLFSPAVNASPTILSVQHQIIAPTNHQHQQIEQQPAAVVMMNRVPIAGYQQYDTPPVVAPVQVLSQAPVIPQQSETYIEQLEANKDDPIMPEDVNISPTSDWEANDRDDRRRDNSQTKNGGNPIESNQWSSEMNSAALFNSSSGGGGGGGNQSDSSSNANSNSRKNDWNDENQHQGRHESNHWSNSGQQNDNYGGGRTRHNNYNRNDQRGRDNGRSNNGMDRGNMRGSNGGGPTMGGYRGRNYSSQSQQNGGGRSGGGVYFRNNDNYYQNGNSNGGGSNNGSGGNYNKDNSNSQRYENTNNYRSRGNNNATNSSNNSRNNSNSTNGNNARSSMSSISSGGMNGPRNTGGRTTGGGAGSSGTSYVNSRQQANPRQPQDVA